jgi:hypothetical protein
VTGGDQLLQHILAHHRAGRIGGTGDDHALQGLARMFSEQRFFRQRPTRVLGNFDRHRLAAERRQNMPVRRIAGLGDRNAVAGFEHRKEREHKCAGRTRRDDDARRIDVCAVALLIVTRDARPQRRNAERFGVANSPNVECGTRCGNRRLRRGRGRLTHFHVNDMTARVLDPRRRCHDVHDHEGRHGSAPGRLQKRARGGHVPI